MGGRLCDSHVALFKEGKYNYDNERRLKELKDRRIVEEGDSEGVCICWDGYKNHSLNHNVGDRSTSPYINLIELRRSEESKGEQEYNDNILWDDVYFAGLISNNILTIREDYLDGYRGKHIQTIGGKYFNDLCHTDSNPEDGCRGFFSNKRTEPKFKLSAKKSESFADSAILNDIGKDSTRHNRSLLIIMWGCPDAYSTTYDYHNNKCIGTGSASFNPSGFYPSIPADFDKKCSQYSLSSNNMIDPLNFTATSIILNKGSKKTLACKTDYSVVLNPGQTSAKITCTDSDSDFTNAAGAPISPVSTSNFTCQPNGCNVATITAFCSENKINCSGIITDIANDATISNLQCEAPEQAKFANNLVCNLGRIDYDSSSDQNKLCGTPCTYTKVNAAKDGFGFGFGTATVSELSVDLPMRLDDVVDFSCLTGFSLFSPSDTATTTAPTITCASGPSGPQIQYGENRCISSTNYCTLNSLTSGAGDVNFSSTDCHQPGILCKKTGSITNSILVSTGQNAIVNCADGTSGTKIKTCQSQNDGTWNGSCFANICTMPAGSNVNILNGQSSQTATAIDHNTTLYCIDGYTASYASGSTALKADCRNVASGAVFGGSCTANTLLH